MFRFFSFPNTTRLNELLNQPNPSLEEILDEECVINEVRNSNHKLISYLCRRETFDSLISYIIEIPSNMPYDPRESRKDEKLNKYPYIACEILSAENDILAQYFLGLISDNKVIDFDTETIPDDTDLERADSMNIETIKNSNSSKEKEDNLNEDTQMEIELVTPIRKFLRFLNSQQPLNLTIAGYFSKVLKNLFCFKPAHMSILLFENHFKYLQRMAINTYADSIQELLTMIIKLDGPYFRNDAKEFYIEKRIQLVQQLILNLFQKPTEDFNNDVFTDLQINSSHILVQLLASIDCYVSGHEIISPLLQSEVLDKMVSGLGDPVLTGALVPLLTQFCEYEGHVYAPKQGMSLLDLSNFTEPVSQSEIPENEPFLMAMINSIDIITAFLHAENKEINPSLIDFQFGNSGFAFGKIRLQMLDLINAYVKLQNEKLSNKIISNNLLPILLELYIKNPWSNIIHSSLTKIFNFILIHGPENIIRALFEQARILDFIIEALKQSDFNINSKTAGKVDKGYRPFLHILANNIEETKFGYIREYCNNHQGWQTFRNKDLREANERNNTKIGGEDPHSTTVSFSGFPRTTLFNGEVIGESNRHLEDNELNSGHYEEPEEEIKLDSEIHALRREENEDHLVNTFMEKDYIPPEMLEQSPTNRCEFIESDIQERKASEVKYPQSVYIKKLLTNETQDDVIINETTGEMETELENNQKEHVST